MSTVEGTFYGIGNTTTQKIGSMIASSTFSLIGGGIMAEFEEKASALFGHRFGVSTCNGTTAIHSALFAVGVHAGHEVIVPTYAFHGMVTPILQLGADPVFCDIYPESLTIDVEHAESLLTSRTRAILALHPWGNPAHLDKLRSLTSARNIVLISDASHAHGAMWSGKPLGHFCDIICASFGVGKLISGGELGLATTNEARIRDRMLLFGHVNRVPRDYLTNDYKCIANAVGIKYRPHAFALQLALDQMDSYLERNRRLVENSNRLLQELVIANLQTQVSFPNARRVFWKVVIIVAPDRMYSLKAAAANAGLSLQQSHYDPLLHNCSIIRDYYGITSKGFPAAERVNACILQLDALQLYDEARLQRYISFVRSVATNTV